MIRMGLIGAGTMGTLYARAFGQHREGRLLAICDLQGDVAEAVADRYGIDRFYTSYERMLDEEELDAVIVATPDFAHRDPVIACLGAGKHVLCEKPLALTVEDCLDIVSAVDRSGKNLMVNFGNRRRPQSLKLCEQLASGKVGDIEYLYMRLNEKRTKTDTLAWAGKTSPLWFLISHLVDYVRWLVGSEIVNVYGLGYTGYLHRERNLDTPDTMVFLARFANGTIATLESTWILPESCSKDVDLRLEVIGEHGAVQVDFCDQGMRTFFDVAHEHSWDWDVPDFRGRVRSWWYDSCYYFVHCLESGERPLPDERDGLAVVEALVAMQQSYERGAAVQVEHHHVQNQGLS